MLASQFYEFYIITYIVNDFSIKVPIDQNPDSGATRDRSIPQPFDPNLKSKNTPYFWQSMKSQNQEKEK